MTNHLGESEFDFDFDFLVVTFIGQTLLTYLAAEL
jgi:hypothetical protein